MLSYRCLVDVKREIGLVDGHFIFITMLAAHCKPTGWDEDHPRVIFASP
jgi:hypothetical protein